MFLHLSGSKEIQGYAKVSISVGDDVVIGPMLWFSQIYWMGRG